MKTQIKEILKNPGKIRDWIFVFITFIYLCGYIIWSFIFYDNSIGIFPVLDPQYFIAGLPISLIILIIFSIIYLFAKTNFFKFVPKYINTKVKVIIISIILLLITYMIKNYFIGMRSHYYGSLNSFLFVVLACFFLIFVAYFLINVLKVSENLFGKKLQTFFKYYFVIGIVGLVISVFFILSYTYIKFVYLNLPQEFGGARPKYALFDLDVSNFSDQTLNRLQLYHAHDLNKNVITTDTLSVLFTTNENYIISLPDSSNNKLDFIEISKSTVNAVNWIK